MAITTFVSTENLANEVSLGYDNGIVAPGQPFTGTKGAEEVFGKNSRQGGEPRLKASSIPIRFRPVNNASCRAGRQTALWQCEVNIIVRRVL